MTALRRWPIATATTCTTTSCPDTRHATRDTRHATRDTRHALRITHYLWDTTLGFDPQPIERPLGVHSPSTLSLQRAQPTLNLEIRSANPDEPGIRPLIEALDAYQLSLYPAESNHLDSAGELGKSNVVFLCASDGDTIMGCAAAKVVDGPELYGEIKRLYVVPDYRGLGLSRRLMQELEARLLGRGVHIARLETGIRQPEALRLYERTGYRKRPPFGDYADDPWSVFMEKKLAE